jgi:predicted DNA-binding protein
MYQIDLAPELEKQLAEWAERNGQSVDSLVGEAIERLLEDLQDIAAADAAMREYDPSKNVSLAELKRSLGLEA